MPPAYRVDHVGSLLRPKALLDARNAKDYGATYTQGDPDSVKLAETDAIRLVLKEQIDRGIRPITNGEYPRPIFYSGLFENLPGMTTFDNLPVPDAFRTDFPTTTGLLKTFGLTTRSAVIATGKIGFDEANPPYLEEWLQIQDLLPDKAYLSQCKITIPAPSYQHIQLKPGKAFTDSSGYTNDESYFHDLAACYTRIIQTLYDHGCRFIQIDDPHLTYFCDATFLAGCEKDGTDTNELLNLYIKVYSWIFQPLKSTNKYVNLEVGMHLCRGNMMSSTHWVSGGYEKIAKKVFNDTSGIHTFFLEFDDVQRTGGFEPLRFLPQGKCVVLGIISTKIAELEDKDKLIQRVKSAADVIAQAWGTEPQQVLRDVLALSPQCGFSSHAAKGGLGMTWERQWEKLGLLREIAQELWPKTP